jgi:hypothetical protein
MIPKKAQRNYYEIEVTQIGIFREGVATPNEVYFFIADIQGARSSIIDETTAIDSRINLGTVVHYATGSRVGAVTSSSTVLRLNNLQPLNRFTVTQCSLSSQTGATVVADTDAVGSLTKFLMTWNITEVSPFNI